MRRWESVLIVIYRLRFLASLAVALCLLLLVAGCSGSGESNGERATREMLAFLDDVKHERVNTTGLSREDLALLPTPPDFALLLPAYFPPGTGPEWYVDSDSDTFLFHIHAAGEGQASFAESPWIEIYETTRNVTPPEPELNPGYEYEDFEGRRIIVGRGDPRNPNARLILYTREGGLNVFLKLGWDAEDPSGPVVLTQEMEEIGFRVFASMLP
jgi:hypothetical protein